MSEFNWKTGVMMVLVGFGLIFEVIKHVPAAEQLDWQNDLMRMNDGRVYSIRDAEELKPKPALKVVPPKFLPMPAQNQALNEALKNYVAATQPMQTDFDKAKKTAATDKDKKAGEEDEWEEVIDPKTGQKVRRKKNKEDAKKEEEKKDAAPPQQVAVTATTPTTEDTPASGTPAAGGIGGPNSPVETPTAAGGAGTASLQKNTFLSLQEWESLLLQNPNPTETQKFITEYQQHLVTSQVFYQIVNMMIADSRETMKQQGVLCASSTPSAASFQVLATVDQNGASGAASKTQADTALEKYVNLSDLGDLQQVMQNSSPYAQILATSKLDEAAKKFLTPGGSAGAGTTAQGTTVANATAFKPFVSVLQSLASNSNSAISSEARQTLSDLQSLLGGGSATTTTASN